MTETNLAVKIQPPEDRRRGPRLVPQLFAGIDEPILDEILASCAVRNIAPGEILLSPGQKNRSVYILLAGSLKVFLDEKDTVFVEIKPGECVGEMSIIDRQPASAFVVSQGPGRILDVHEDNFWRLIGSSPKAAKNLLTMLSHRIRIRDQADLRRMHERLALEKELKIARAIQASMLTSKFDELSKGGVDVFAVMEPVREIGGDFYDAFHITPTKLFVCVGDVVGKGIPAALFMVQSVTRLRMEAMRNAAPDTILRRVNRALCENNEQGMFLTLFCGVLDTATGELVYANGGHNPPLCDLQDGRFDFIPMPEGLIVGLFENAAYDSARLVLKPGQSLLAYTDGVPEAMSVMGEFFCEERLRIVLNEHSGTCARGLLEAVRREVYAFAGNEHPPDDITLLALRYTGAGEQTEI